MSYVDELYRPIYDDPAFGTDISFTLTDLSEFPLRGLDKTVGVEVAGSTLEIGTVRPACVILMVDLVAEGFSPEDLMNAIVSFNGGQWRVVNYFAKPSPLGDLDGELYLILSAITEGSE